MSQDINKETEERSRWFGTVMAYIHGDGGQYLAEHGAEKAANDAITKFFKNVEYIESIKYRE